MLQLEYREELEPGKKYQITDYEDLKQKLIASLQEYQISEVNEDTYDLAKKNRAALNSLAKKIDERRKQAEKTYMSSFMLGKNQCKELISIINQVSLQLDAGIKKIENAERDEKRTELFKYWDSKNVYPVHYTQIENERWYNKGEKIEDCKKAIDAKREEIGKDLLIIDSTVKNKKARKLTKAFYFKTLELKEAISQAEEMLIILDSIDESEKGEKKE